MGEYCKNCYELAEQLHHYKQIIKEINNIAEQQVPYLNIDKAKTCMEVEFDYAGKVWSLEQKIYKIIQKCEMENE